MIDQFVGIKYQLNESENFEEYLKACGVGFLVRKMILSFTPVVELVDNKDGSYTVKTSTTFRDMLLTFKLDEEFDQEFPDGRKVKTTVSTEGENKLVEVQAGEKEVKIIREFSKEEVLMTFHVGDITATRSYKVVN